MKKMIIIALFSTSLLAGVISVSSYAQESEGTLGGVIGSVLPDEMNVPTEPRTSEKPKEPIKPEEPSVTEKPVEPNKSTELENLTVPERPAVPRQSEKSIDVVVTPNEEIVAVDKSVPLTQTADGLKPIKSEYKVLPSGNVQVKSADGKMKVLPYTGEKMGIIGSIAGVCLTVLS